MTNSAPLPLRDALAKSKIASVTVVDDAFDPVSAKIFTGAEIEQLVAELEADPEAASELAELSLDVTNVSDASPAVLGALLGHAKDGRLKKLVDQTLRPTASVIQDQLKPFLGQLEALGLTVNRVGTDSHEVPAAEIVFLDLYLGVDAPEASIGRAISAARAIYSNIESQAEGKGAVAPLVVLMSSHPDLVARAPQFRAESELLGGMFHFIAKDELNDEFRLMLRLRVLAASREMGTELYRFMRALPGRLDAAKKTFLKALLELSLGDFWCLQRLTLLKEGQPLGDYLFELLSTFHGHLAFAEELAEIRKAIDGLAFTEVAIGHGTPSAQLADIYTCALLDNTVGELVAHPHAEQGATVGHLHLGDLFVHASDLSVLAVATAECDLAFSPIGGRQPQAKTVLFIPGRLQETKGTLAGDLLDYRGTRYRVDWDPVSPVTYPVLDTVKSLADAGYARVARLRLGPALRLQREFASNLTRVGMPVPPPVVSPRNCKIFLNDAGDLVARGECAGVLRSGHHVVLSPAVIAKLHDVLVDHISAVRARVAALKEEGKTGEAGSALQRIEKHVAACEKGEAWAALLRPQEFSGKSKMIDELLLLVTSDIPQKVDKKVVLIAALVEPDANGPAARSA